MQPWITTTPCDLLPSRPGYDAWAALASAELARISYLPSPEAQTAILAAGYDGAREIASGPSSVLLAWSYAASVVVVACRGSAVRGDWLDDLHFFPRPWRPLVRRGLVCRGFRAHTLRVLGAVRQAVIELTRGAGRGRRVVVTGHSLGAAMAPFLALALADAGVDVASIYCHEMPRAMTHRAASFYDGRFKSRTFRMVMVRDGEQDLVTRLPPSAWGFWHVGTPEIIVDGKRYESEAAWEAVRARHPLGFLDALGALYRLRESVSAHLSGYLVEELRRQVTKEKPPAGQPTGGSQSRA